METSLAIGDFSRATHLSVKTLRHYHEIGLLEPAAVDAATGYRRYTTDQIPTAQVIRRFRSLDMPLAEIGAVLGAPDLETRNAMIADHLGRLENDLVRTQGAVASLRELLRPVAAAAPIEHRRIEATPAAAIGEVLEIGDALPWFLGALAELDAALRSQRVAPTGPAGGVYANELFTEERGEATIFVPTSGTIRPIGRVRPLVIPGAELATTLHTGAHDEIDRAYGLLATYVAEHALGVDGPLREYYLRGPRDSDDERAWRTEIGWPIFATAAPTRP